MSSSGRPFKYARELAAARQEQQRIDQQLAERHREHHNPEHAAADATAVDADPVHPQTSAHRPHDPRCTARDRGRGHARAGHGRVAATAAGHAGRADHLSPAVPAGARPAAASSRSLPVPVLPAPAITSRAPARAFPRVRAAARATRRRRG